ncbi:MAG: amidohydrolase family protein [Leptolyngbyaceae cyanobacterium RU_5_1]|nr:amidohydrolase family protein [Leptolyngbyaceae cyanobacterium RU_5_1]
MATIFRNTYLLDPVQGLEGRGDVLVENGKIVGILQDELAIGKIVPILVPQWGTEIIDLEGAFLSPGWIDLHTHTFSSIGDFCLPADDVGIRSGVTTIADAGTSGILTFDAFRRTVIDTAKTRTYAFINPSLLYIATSDFIAHRLEIIANPRNQDLERAAAVIEANRDVIVGLKVHPAFHQGETRSPIMDAARSLADRFSLPLMVNLGRFVPHEVLLSPEGLLALLKPGDIVTHCFQPHDGLFDGNGNLLPGARAAIDRGVLLDVGYSKNHFSIELARTALAHEILPNTLSTDLSRLSPDPAGSLAAVITRFVSLGMSLGQAIERVTIHPARILSKATELGCLKPGMLADFTIFNWVDEATNLEDGKGTSLPVSQMLKVQGVCRSGEYIKIERSPFDPKLTSDDSQTPALV